MVVVELLLALLVVDAAKVDEQSLLLSLGSAQRNAWTPLTKTLLGMGANGDDQNICYNHPTDNELFQWGDSLSNALSEEKFKKKLEPFFGRFKETGGFDLNADQLTVKLKNTADVLGQVCRAQSEIGSDLQPEWDNEHPEVLKAQAIKFVYDNLFFQFDSEGFSSMVSQVMGDSSRARFTQSMQKIEYLVPHCDLNARPSGNDLSMTSGKSAFPGGPFRLNFGFNLAKWLTEELMALVEGQGGAAMSTAAPIGSMMSMMAVMAVISIVETVVAIILDIVPPMIPFPFWIMWSLPCLPMLTGPNCLFSVLYPVSLPDFLMGSTSDQIMDGIITAFPEKYASKVGKTSDGAFKLCAAAYLGMNCASIFPLCWIPIGVREAWSFPMCFIHCILTLVACPGFWIEDIIGPCQSVSVPPLCSFSLFLNYRRIPPQYTSYEEAHPYPADCPAYDPSIDLNIEKETAAITENQDNEAVLKEIDRDISQNGRGGSRDISKLYKTQLEGLGLQINSEGDAIPAERLMGSLSDYDNVIMPKTFICDCSKTYCFVSSAKPAPEECNDITEGCKQACSSSPSRKNFRVKKQTVISPPLMSVLAKKQTLLAQPNIARESIRSHFGHVFPVL